MTQSIEVRRGGAAGAAWTNYTPQVPIFTGDSEPRLDTGMMANNGSACQWQFHVHDDVGEIPRADGAKNLPAHVLVKVFEDAPGFGCVLGWGRIARKDAYRGDMVMGAARQWTVTVEDANVDMRGLTLTADWSRGAETDVARVLALLAAFCNGSPRATTVIQNHLVSASSPVTMPAKVYPAGTELPEIVADCMTTGGKIWSVVIHHQAGVSHLCLLYVPEGDLTTFVSDIGITDDAPDLVNWFPPEWDSGPATIEESQDLVTGIVLRYTIDAEGEEIDPEGTVFVQDAADVATYDYWVLPFTDALTGTPTQATTRANALRETRSHERLTHALSITIPATEVDRLSAGMAIQIKSRAAMGGQYGGTIQTRRIAQLKWEKVAADLYKAHLELDRPLQLAPSAGGIGNAAVRALAAGTRAIQAIQDLSMGGANLVKNSSFESVGGWHVGPHWVIDHNPADPQTAYHGQNVARLEMNGSVPESGELVNI